MLQPIRYTLVISAILIQAMVRGQVLTCGSELSKEEGDVHLLVAGDDGTFYAVAGKAKKYTIQERDASGALLRTSPLELQHKEEDFKPIAIIKTTKALGVLGEWVDGKVYERMTALFPIDPATFKQGRSETVVTGKYGAEYRRFELHPGAAVSPNGEHAVAWRADCYTWYKDPRDYSLVACDADLKAVDRWKVQHPNGPGDRFEQVTIDDKGDVYVIAIHDKVPGQRKEYGRPSGASSVFEVLRFSVGMDEPVRTTLMFDRPVADLFLIHTNDDRIICCGLSELALGGKVFTCELDKKSLQAGTCKVGNWQEAQVTFAMEQFSRAIDDAVNERVTVGSVAEVSDSRNLNKLDMNWQPPIATSDGWIVTGHFEHQSLSDRGSVDGFHSTDQLVMRINTSGKVSAVRVPLFQSSSWRAMAGAGVHVQPDGNVRLLLNDHEQKGSGEQKRVYSFLVENGGGVVRSWTIDKGMNAETKVIDAEWAKNEGRSVGRAITLTDGAAVIPVITPVAAGIPPAGRLCLLR